MERILLLPLGIAIYKYVLVPRRGPPQPAIATGPQWRRFAPSFGPLNGIPLVRKGTCANVLILLGLSGSGKSTLAAAFAAKNKFQHFELDQSPDDGVDVLNLRREWDDFFLRAKPGGLFEQLLARASDSGKTGAVLSTPSLVVLSIAHIEASKQRGAATVVLYGSAADCIRSYVQRETTIGRHLSVDHWISNNQASYVNLSRPEYAPYRLQVFGQKAHCSKSALVAALEQRLAA